MNTKNLNLHNYFLSVFIAGTLLVSCNNKNKSSNVKETFNLVKSAKDVVKKDKELKEIEPITEEELHNWFPKILLGMELKKISKGSLMGYGIIGASVVYQGDGK